MLPRHNSMVGTPEAAHLANQSVGESFPSRWVAIPQTSPGLIPPSFKRSPSTASMVFGSTVTGAAPVMRPILEIKAGAFSDTSRRFGLPFPVTRAESRARLGEGIQTQYSRSRNEANRRAEGGKVRSVNGHPDYAYGSNTAGSD